MDFQEVKGVFESEKKVLAANFVPEDFFWMNPRDPEMAKKALAKLKRLRK